jgi:LPS-assembly protein
VDRSAEKTHRSGRRFRRAAIHPGERVLVYRANLIGRTVDVIGYLLSRNSCVPHLAVLLVLSSFGISAQLLAAQQIRKPPATGGVAELSSAGPQRKQGDLFIADDAVDLRYGDQRLRADHIEYNERTNEALARGHLKYDYENEHLEADEGHYNVSTGRGTFRNVRGTIRIERHANPTVLVSDNPLYFEARDVEKFGSDLFVVRHAWITVCDPRYPKWQFYAPKASVRLGKTVALVNANFRLFRVPLIWMPYATAPAGPKIRQSGFMVPVAGNSTAKGFVFGDALYWAPYSWMDTTLGAELFSKRGSAERGQFRMTPWENTKIQYNYFAVIDREHQGGHEQQVEVQSLLRQNWRFVADVNELSSLTFRLAFAPTYGEAINSDIRSSVFLTHNFGGFNFNVASLSDRSFLNTAQGQSVLLRNVPQGRFSSVEQSPWHALPVYFGFDGFVGAVHREDVAFPTTASYVPIQTSSFVPRTEFAPRITFPLHLGQWLGATSTAVFRGTYYGSSLDPAGFVTNRSITRNDGEFTLDLRLPTLERFFNYNPGNSHKPHRRYKHTVEPNVTYRYVTGIDNFAQLIRFDADATRSDTNEVEYGLTQRLWSKSGEDQPQELLSWSLLQKHYFNPTFGGAIFNNQRNVLEALDSVTPFAFALGPRNSSPLVSDFHITPAGRFDTEQVLEYDPQLRKISAIGTLVKVRPFSEFFATLAHFRLQADPLLQPLSNQFRVLTGYGSETRRGFNVMTGISYDFTNNALQNELAQISYNGKCCGLALEYRRLQLGPVRTDNQFRVAFIIANIGTFGNLRHQERIF